MDKDKSKTQGLNYRAGIIERADDNTNEIAISFSSETDEVSRYYMGREVVEILDHSDGSVKLDRMRQGVPFLVDHWRDEHIGRVNKPIIGEDRKGRAVVRFGKSARAEEIKGDILEGIRPDVSVGYRVLKAALEESEVKGTPDTLRVTLWEPIEVSSVAVPADVSVGFGRESEDGNEIIISDTKERVTMGKDDKTPGTDPGANSLEINVRTVEPPAPEPTPTPTPTVDVGAVQEEARKMESARVNEIRAIAVQLEPHAAGVRELAEKYVGDYEKSAEDFRKEAVGLLAAKPIAAAPGHLGMSENEVRSYSILKAVDAFLRKDWSKAGLELEASVELAKLRQDKPPEGFLVPLDIPYVSEQGMRVLTAAGSATGLEMVGTDHLSANFIDALRQRVFVFQLGANILPGLVGDVSIPSMADATFYHVAEDADITDSTPATSAVSLSPKTLGGSVPMSRKFIKQGTPAAEMTIRNLLVRGAAVEMEAKILAGSGSAGQPLGIIGQTGIATSTIASAGAPTWTELVEFETDVLTAKGLYGSLAWCIAPTVQGHCKVTLKTSAVAGYLMEGNQINGYPVFPSTNMPANGILFGDFESVIVGTWGGMDVKPDEATKAAAGGLVIRVFQDYDVGVEHAAKFSKNA